MSKDTSGLSETERAILAEAEAEEFENENVTKDDDVEASDDDDLADDEQVSKRPEPPIGVDIDFEVDDAEIEKLNAQVEALEAKIDDVESDENFDLSETEKRVEVRRLNAEIRKIERKITSAEMKKEFSERMGKKVSETRQQYIQQQFEADVADFRQIDNNDVFFSNKLLWPMFKSTYDELRQNPENQSKSNGWFLRKAARETAEQAEQLGFKVPRKSSSSATAAATNAKAGKPAGNGKKPSSALKDIPPTLGGIPAADGETGGGKFEHLDGLDGMALEAAVAKMSRTEQLEWASS